MEKLEIENIIRYYFHLGLKQEEMLLYLLQNHFIMSSSTLKRHLTRMNLYRRKAYSADEKVVEFLESQVLMSGGLHGYKWMHRKCLQAGINTKQETVRQLLNLIDPNGVSTRRAKKLQRRQYFNKGPNYLWHIDGYDKLKPYGICISGCIDGFSRKILWLKASYTNNNPKVIGAYYLQAVKSLGGCPQTVRTDMGTENVVIEDLQIYFHEIAESNGTAHVLPPFIYGTSQSNQRIESWWSILRKHNIQFWMNVFSQLKEDGVFDGTFLDKSILQYCFMDIIQEELNTVVLEWNAHTIRKSRHSISPGGRPDILFDFPEIYNCRNYLVSLVDDHIEHCDTECLYEDRICSDEDVFELCEVISSEMRLKKPTDVFEGLNSYMQLRSEIRALL